MAKQFRVEYLIITGWMCLLMSSACEYMSTTEMDSSSVMAQALWLFVARFFGFGSFVAGAFSLFNQFWTNGTLLLIGSVALPFVSLFFYGVL